MLAGEYLKFSNSCLLTHSKLDATSLVSLGSFHFVKFFSSGFFTSRFLLFGIFTYKGVSNKRYEEKSGVRGHRTKSLGFLFLIINVRTISRNTLRHSMAFRKSNRRVFSQSQTVADAPFAQLVLRQHPSVDLLNTSWDPSLLLWLWNRTLQPTGTRT